MANNPTLQEYLAGKSKEFEEQHASLKNGSYEQQERWNHKYSQMLEYERRHWINTYDRGNRDVDYVKESQSSPGASTTTKNLAAVETAQGRKGTFYQNQTTSARGVPQEQYASVYPTLASGNYVNPQDQNTMFRVVGRDNAPSPKAEQHYFLNAGTQYPTQTPFGVSMNSLPFNLEVSKGFAEKLGMINYRVVRENGGVPTLDFSTPTGDLRASLNTTSAFYEPKNNPADQFSPELRNANISKNEFTYLATRQQLSKEKGFAAGLANAADLTGHPVIDLQHGLFTHPAAVTGKNRELRETQEILTGTEQYWFSLADTATEKRHALKDRSLTQGAQRLFYTGEENVGRYIGYSTGIFATAPATSLRENPTLTFAQGAAAGAFLNTAKSATYSLTLWGGAATASKAQTVFNYGTLALGAAYAGKQAYEVYQAPTPEAKAGVLGDTWVQVSTFEAGRKLTERPIRQAFLYGVDLPIYRGFQRYGEGMKGSKVLPAITLTKPEVLGDDGPFTFGSVMGNGAYGRFGDAPNTNGLLFAGGSTAQKRIASTLREFYTPQNTRTPGAPLSNTGMVSRNSYHYENVVVPVESAGGRATAWPYSEVLPNYGVRQSVFSGKSTSESLELYHAYPTTLPYPRMNILPGTSENQGMSFSNGMATRFLKISYNQPEQMGLFGDTSSPGLLRVHGVKPGTLGVLAEGARQPYAYGDVAAMTSSRGVFVAQKMQKGGMEAELIIPSGVVDSAKIGQLGANTPAKPWFIKETPFIERTAVLEAGYKGKASQYLGFRDVTIVDDMLIPIRDVTFKGFWQTTRVPKATNEPGSEKGYLEETKWVSARSIKATHGRVGLRGNVEGWSNQPVMEVSSSSRAVRTRGFGEYGYSLLTTGKASPASPYSGSSSQASTYSYGLSPSYSLSSGSSSSLLTSTLTSSSISSSLRSMSSSSSSSSSTSTSTSSSLSSGRYSWRSSFGYSYTESYEPSYNSLGFNSPLSGRKGKRKKRTSENKTFRVLPLSGAGNQWITGTFSNSITSPGRERLSEFKQSRAMGTDFFQTKEARTRQGRRAFRDFGVRL